MEISELTVTRISGGPAYELDFTHPLLPPMMIILWPCSLLTKFGPAIVGYSLTGILRCTAVFIHIQRAVEMICQDEQDVAINRSD